jgi:hypothetical protein
MIKRKPKIKKTKEVAKEGRPSVFESPIEMELKIDEYFDNCPDKKTIVLGNGTIEISAITITGLCIYLGFDSRQSFYDYEKKEQFSYIIKKARLKVENYYEKCLQYGNVTGAIFPLKNMGWSDKSEIEQRVNIITDPFKQIRENAGLNDSNKEAATGN